MTVCISDRGVIRMTKIYNRIKSHSLLVPFCMLAIIAIAIIKNFIPLGTGSFLLLLLFGGVTGTYFVHRVFKPGLTAGVITFVLFCIGGVIRGFDNIFPLLGLFIYAGLGIVNLLRATVLFPANIKPIARSLFGFLFVVYIIASCVYLILFPRPSFTFIPILIAVIPAVSITVFIKRKLCLYEKHDEWKLRISLKQGIGLIITVSVIVSSLSYYYFNKKAHLVEAERAKITRLTNVPGYENSFDRLIEIGYAYIKIEDVENAEKFLSKARLLDRDNQVVDAYFSYLNGLKAKVTPKFNEKVGLVQDAICDFDMLVKNNTDNHEIIYLRGLLYSELPTTFGKRRIAIEDFKRILLDMDYNERFFNLASYKLLAIAPGEVKKFPTGVKEKIYSDTQ